MISSKHFAIQCGGGGTWIVYRYDDSQTAVWESHYLKKCVEWANQEVRKNMKKLIGLSLSFCIKDICERKISIEAVAGIVPNFDWKSTTLEAVHERYSQVYWKNYPERSWEVLKQIKLLDRHPSDVNIADGHWILEENYSPQISLGYQEGTSIAYQDQNIGAKLKMQTEQAAIC